MSKPAEPSDKPRRFYKTVATAGQDGGFAVTLDGRAAKTPSGRVLVVPTEPLGALLADEWSAQGDHVDYRTMPATRLAFTTLDRLEGRRSEVAAEMAKLMSADQLCYFAEGPDALIERQELLWSPWLVWAKQTLDFNLMVARGIGYLPQPPKTLERAQALAAAKDDFTLCALVFAGGLYSSAVLAFAVSAGALDGLDAFDLCRLDEAFQEERWGVDAEAAARTASLRRDAVMIDAWFKALRSYANV